MDVWVKFLRYSFTSNMNISFLFFFPFRITRQILMSLPPILDMIILLLFFMLIFSILGVFVLICVLMCVFNMCINVCG